MACTRCIASQMLAQGFAVQFATAEVREAARGQILQQFGPDAILPAPRSVGGALPAPVGHEMPRVCAVCSAVFCPRSPLPAKKEAV